MTGTYEQAQKRMSELAAKMVGVLLKIPANDRGRFARAQLTSKLPQLVVLFDSIPSELRGKTVLFVSFNPHSRETRFAAAAKLAGWNPILVHLGKTGYDPTHFFTSSAKLDDILQLVLTTWLFPGPLVHCFVLRGDHALVLALTKNKPLVVDIYDTCAGIKSTLPAERASEREVIYLADGITHRDLRIKYLQNHQGYTLPKNNIFLHDPLPDVEIPPQIARSETEIRVVSVGWVGAGENSILRIGRALCASQIHLHIYFNLAQDTSGADAQAYLQLSTESEYLHIEEPAHGSRYWQELSRFDFGLAVFEPAIYKEPFRSYSEDYIRGCGSSRLSDYISMNLGIISTPDLCFQYFWARRFASSVVSCTQAFLANPRRYLEAALEAKTSKARTSISIQGVAERLGAFYTRVADQGSTPSRRVK